MSKQLTFFDLDLSYRKVSHPDPLENISKVVDFEVFREVIEK